jgi:hypothetical protein
MDSTISTNDVADLNHALDALLPLLPPGVAHVLASLSLLILPLMVLGRVLLGWRQSGLWGAICGLFAGTNAPPSLQPCIRSGPPPAAKVISLIMLGLLALALAGCAHVGTTQTSHSDTWTDTNGVPHTVCTRRTDAYAWTLLDSQDSLSQYSAVNSATNSSLSVGTLSQSSSTTNLESLISAVVSAAVSAAK